MNTLLITGTIKPLVKIKRSDPALRCAEYKRNLKRYISDTKFDRFIFAENSGYPIDVSYFQKIAKEKGKEFLFLDVSINADSRTMSTGEARIIQQVLAMCPFLQDEEHIWKVSGRVFIRNANKIIDKTKSKNGNIFLYAPKYDSLQTWFCRIKVADLKRYFLTEDAIDSMKYGCIEYVWMDTWKARNKEILMMRFPVYPDAEGINSSGQPYTQPKHKMIIKDLLLKLGYFTPNANKHLDRSGI